MRVNCILLADVSNCNTKGAPTAVADAVRLHFAIVKNGKNGVECCSRLTVWGQSSLLFGVWSRPYCLGAVIPYFSSRRV